MKKIIGILFVLFIISGCAEPTVESEEQKNVDTRFSTEHFEDIEPYNEIIILTDSKTGCEYIIHGGSKFDSGMSVLLDEYGKPSGCFKINE